MSTYQIKQIEGFSGYWIDTDGIVWSQRWRRTRSYCVLAEKRTLKPCIQWSGHLNVNLRIDGRYERRSVHRLVAQAFIPNCDNKPCACHINGNPQDNKVENLYWGTKKENTADMKKHGVMVVGEKLPQSKLNPRKIKLIRLLYSFFEWKQTRIAKLFGVHSSDISRIVNNIYWKQVSSNH